MILPHPAAEVVHADAQPFGSLLVSRTVFDHLQRRRILPDGNGGTRVLRHLLTLLALLLQLLLTQLLTHGDVTAAPPLKVALEVMADHAAPQGDFRHRQRSGAVHLQRLGIELLCGLARPVGAPCTAHAARVPLVE